jgi:hypothetical protein
MFGLVLPPGGPVRNGLKCWLDAGITASYSAGANPANNTTITDISGSGNNGTIYQGGSYSITWTSAGLASYWNFTKDTNYNPIKTYIASTNAQNYQTVTVVFYPDFTLNNTVPLVGLVGTATTGSTGTDCSLRFAGANGTGPWTFNTSVSNPNDWDYTIPTWYNNQSVYAGTSGNLVNGWNVLSAIRTNFQAGTTFAGTFGLYLGSGNFFGDNRNFQGRLAAIVAYDRQLTAAEQLQNYAYFRGRFGV